MDLIYTNSENVEQGVITNFVYDQEDATTSSDRCTFEIDITAKNNVFEIGSYVYIPNTEIGGRIDSIQVDTGTQIVYAKGRTWRGLLATKLLYSETADEYEITGKIDAIFSSLIANTFQMDVFNVLPISNAPQVNLRVPNYSDLYYSITKALSTIDYKMVTTFNPITRKVDILFKPIDKYTDLDSITSDMFQFKVQTGAPRVNHAIGVSDTLVCHRYLQEDGTMGNTKFYVGNDEIVKMYELSADGITDLEQKTDDALLQEQSDDTLEVTALDLHADLLDEFTAEDMLTNVRMTQNVTRKIVSINHDIAKYQYEVGERRL